MQFYKYITYKEIEGPMWPKLSSHCPLTIIANNYSQLNKTPFVYLQVWSCVYWKYVDQVPRNHIITLTCLY